MNPTVCSICVRLGSVEKSYARPGAPMDDRPLPTAATRLEIIPSFEYEDKERYHVRRCPECGNLYSYGVESVTTTNGIEDEETLARLSPASASIFLHQQARLLEAIRRDIDDTGNAAAALGDYINRGHPPPKEIPEIVEHMQMQRAQVLHGQDRLHAQVEAYRRSCPEILLIWAQAHRRTCQYYVMRSEKAVSRPGFDAQTARYVARTTLEAWESLPERGETFISINTAFLLDYYDRLQVELEK